MTTKRAKLLTSLVLFLVLLGVAMAAENGLIPGTQSPERTFQGIIGPVINFFNSAFNFFQNLITKVLDFEWLRDQFVNLFHSIDGWVYKIFRMNISEILKEIGALLINIFNLIIDFAKRIWPL